MTRRMGWVVLAAVGLWGLPSLAVTPPLIVVADFESGTLEGLYKIRVNLPTITTERKRVGTYALKSYLSADRDSQYERERTESMILGSPTMVGQENWYGFSVFLPLDYVPDNIWELVAQWHVDPDDAVEDAAARYPAMALWSDHGIWQISNSIDADAQTTSRASITQRKFNLGAYETNKWTDWVFRVKWSYQSDGILQVWKDGKKVIDAPGPNCYNDKKGPYVKLGVYKGWGTMTPDKVRTRTVFHDEFRMATAAGSYDTVAPGAGKRPQPPTQLTIQ